MTTPKTDRSCFPGEAPAQKWTSHYRAVPRSADDPRRKPEIFGLPFLLCSSPLTDGAVGSYFPTKNSCRSLSCRR
jgi:hypothetical protein